MENLRRSAIEDTRMPTVQSSNKSKKFRKFFTATFVLLYSVNNTVKLFPEDCSQCKVMQSFNQCMFSKLEPCLTMSNINWMYMIVLQ